MHRSESPDLSFSLRQPPKSPNGLNSPVEQESDNPKWASSKSWRLYDDLALLFVIVPFSAGLFRFGQVQPHWSLLLSNIFTVIEVGCTVKFLITWPPSWTDKLQGKKEKVGRMMRNLVKKEGDGKLDKLGEPEGTPFEVLAPIMGTATFCTESSQKLQVFGFAAEILGVTISVVLLLWVRSHVVPPVMAEACNVNIVMFSLWEGFKWATRLACVVYEESEGKLQNELNQNGMEQSFDAKTRMSMRGNGEYSSGPIHKSASAVPHVLKEVTVTITPFPMSIQPRRQAVLQRNESAKITRISPLPVIKEAEHERVVTFPRKKLIKEVEHEHTLDLEDIITKVHSPEGLVVLLPMPEVESLQKKTEDFLRESFMAVKESDDPFAEQHVTIPQFLSHSWSKIHEYMRDPSKTKRILFFETLHRSRERQQNRAYNFACGVAELIRNFDVHRGKIGVIYRLLCRPAVAAVKFFYSVVFLIPYNIAKLSVSLVLFLPRIWVRIFILSPIYLVVDYFGMHNRKTFREYRNTHGFPMSEGKLSQAICKAILENMGRSGHNR